MSIVSKDWLTYSGGTDGPGEHCYIFSISIDITQMVNFATQISDCDSHSPAFLDLFHSSDASICFTMVLAPLGNSDHVFVLVLIDFLSNSHRNALFRSTLCHFLMAILVLIGMVFVIM